MDKLTLGFSEIKNERGLFVEIRILFTYLVFADERLEQAKREGVRRKEEKSRISTVVE